MADNRRIISAAHFKVFSVHGGAGGERLRVAHIDVEGFGGPGSALGRQGVGVGKAGLAGDGPAKDTDQGRGQSFAAIAPDAMAAGALILEQGLALMGRRAGTWGLALGQGRGRQADNNQRKTCTHA